LCANHKHTGAPTNKQRCHHLPLPKEFKKNTPQQLLLLMCPAMMALALVVATICSATASITLPSMYSSHMVLQSDQPAELWGMTETASKVSVKVSSITTPLLSTADASGRFR
jgi:hypothetical protein